MKLKALFALLKDTFNEWSEDKAQRLGAALAYYAIFSLAPLLVIAIAIGAAIFGEEAAQGEVSRELRDTLGQPAAEAIEKMIVATKQSGAGTVATIIGFATLLFGALGLFVQLQDALNTIWKVAPKPERGIVGTVKDRLLSFALVLAMGVFLLVSLGISTGLSALNRLLPPDALPGGIHLWQVIHAVISLGLITLLFAMIYKFLPDAVIAWRDVWVGAAVTALLFTLGKYLLGLYLGQASVTSTYGAAGSLVAVLLWVYYSSQILLFGAEFTRVYADRYGTRVVPTENAVAVTIEMRARQGMALRDEG